MKFPGGYQYGAALWLCVTETGWKEGRTFLD